MSFLLLARLSSGGLTTMVKDEDLDIIEFDSREEASRAIHEFNKQVEDEHEHIVDFQVVEVEV